PATAVTLTFSFQAEDGIRDFHVTGVQTCALPIYGGHHIPTKDIVRRQTTSMQNLLTNLRLIDHLIVIDNIKASGEIVLEIEHNEIGRASCRERVKTAGVVVSAKRRQRWSTPGDAT